MTEASFLAELKRRNVLRAGAFYLAAAWLVWQVATSVLPVFEVSTAWLRWVVVALAIIRASCSGARPILRRNGSPAQWRAENGADGTGAAP